MRALQRTFTAAVLLMIVLAGCGEGDRVDQVELPTTPVLSLRAGWAVVSATYARVLESPDPESSIVGHLRRGVVLEIVSKSNYTERVGEATDFWYQVRSENFSGWVFGSAVELYNSRERARNAAGVLGNE
jgi:hypothetical protein